MMNISLDCLHAALREKNLLKAKDIQNSTSYETVKCILDSEVCFALLFNTFIHVKCSIHF